MNVPPDALDKLSLLGSAIGAFWGVALPIAGGVLTYWGIEFTKSLRKHVTPEEWQLLRQIHIGEWLATKEDGSPFAWASIVPRPTGPRVELAGKVYPHPETPLRDQRRWLRRGKSLLRKGHVTFVDAEESGGGKLRVTEAGRLTLQRCSAGIDGRRSWLWKIAFAWG